MPGDATGMCYTIAQCYHLIAGSGTRPLVIAIKQHIRIRKQLHHSMNMLGREFSKARVIHHLVGCQQTTFT